MGGVESFGFTVSKPRPLSSSSSLPPSSSSLFRVVLRPRVLLFSSGPFFLAPGSSSWPSNSFSWPRVHLLGPRVFLSSRLLFLSPEFFLAPEFFFGALELFFLGLEFFLVPEFFCLVPNSSFFRVFGPEFSKRKKLVISCSWPRVLHLLLSLRVSRPSRVQTSKSITVCQTQTPAAVPLLNFTFQFRNAVI